MSAADQRYFGWPEAPRGITIAALIEFRRAHLTPEVFADWLRGGNDMSPRDERQGNLL